MNLCEKYGAIRNAVVKLIRLLTLFAAAYLGGCASPHQGVESPPTQAQVNEFNFALSIFRNANFAEARDAFARYANQHPQGRLTVEALFWKGNAHYALKEFGEAIATLKKVREAPHNRYAPEAMLTIASSQIESGAIAEGRTTLQQVVNQYPQSEAATRARQLLGLAQLPQAQVSYAARIGAAIRQHIVYVDYGGNPVTEVTVRLASNGSILERTVTKASDVPAWDAAVIRAIDKVEVLPLDKDAGAPASLVLIFRPR